MIRHNAELQEAAARLFKGIGNSASIEVQEKTCRLLKGLLTAWEAWIAAEKVERQANRFS